jgi:leucyl/phenylalanyl-tRNA---protein transferase
MIYELTEELAFPGPGEMDEGDVIAVGGDLGVERLLLAYRSGIFPWILDGETIEWWCPDPRFVLFPDKLRVTKSLGRIIKSGRFTVTFDRDFPAVIRGCQQVPRPWNSAPWITDEVVQAYCAFHEAGHAHSVEVWQGDELAGGLYGVSIGGCFFGESMFSNVSNASKTGFVALVKKLQESGCSMIDCQVPTDHLAGFGAECISRSEFLRLVA